MVRLWITAVQLEEIDTYFKNYYDPNQLFLANMTSLNIHVFHAKIQHGKDIPNTSDSQVSRVLQFCQSRQSEFDKILFIDLV